jgi:hypothetical protein
MDASATASAPSVPARVGTDEFSCPAERRVRLDLAQDAWRIDVTHDQLEADHRASAAERRLGSA